MKTPLQTIAMLSALAIQPAAFAVPSKHPPKPQSEAPSNGAAANPLLKGRIEAAVRLERLPEYLFSPGVAPKLDQLRIKGGSASAFFPNYMAGTWSGKLKTVWSAKSPEMDFIAQSRVGNTADIEFKFKRVGQGLELEPTRLYFPPELREFDEVLLDKMGWEGEDPAEVKKRWKAQGGKLEVHPCLSIGPMDTTTATGKEIKTSYVYDTITELTPRCVEQDLVMKQVWDRYFECYRETVTRFTWYSANRIYCQLVYAEYNEDGTYKRRILLQGWLTKTAV